MDTPSGGHDNDDYQRYESSEQAHGRLLGDFDTLLIENTDLCRWYRSPEAKLRHRGRDVNNTILYEGCTPRVKLQCKRWMICHNPCPNEGRHTLYRIQPLIKTVAARFAEF